MGIINMNMQQLKNIWHFFEAVFWVVYYRFPAQKLKTIGVTGTDGKTTTSFLIYEMLKAAGQSVGMITTVETKFWHKGKEVILPNVLHATTPGAAILQRVLATMLNQGVEVVVVETTSHALDQYRVWGCNFLIGVWTNLAHEHLDYHKTMERYASAKLRLFAGVRFAVLNKDDAWFDWFRTRILQAKIVEYGPFVGTAISQTLGGDYNRYNISAAAKVAELLGVDSEVISRVVKTFVGVPGRREEIKNSLGIRTIVDFAHTPQALEQLLGSLRMEVKKGKIILVFGCTGRRDFAKRPVMTSIAVKLADKVIITSDDAYDEPLDKIFADMTRGVDMARIEREDDRDVAILRAVKLAKKGDIVVATGMGHEQTQRIGEREIERSDKRAFEQAILR